MEVPLVILVGVAVLVLFIQIPLWILRLKTGLVITSNEYMTDNLSVQFGIRHILISTTITAVLIALGQLTFANAGFEGGPIPWREIVGFCFIYVTYSALITLSTVALVFWDNARIASGLVLVGLTFGGSFLAVQLLENFFGPVGFWGLFTNSCLYSLGNSLGILFVLIVFYRLDFRLLKLNPL